MDAFYSFMRSSEIMPAPVSLLFQTIRAGGEVQIWNASTGHQEGLFCIGEKVTMTD